MGDDAEARVFLQHVIHDAPGHRLELVVLGVEHEPLGQDGVVRQHGKLRHDGGVLVAFGGHEKGVPGFLALGQHGHEFPPVVTAQAAEHMPPHIAGPLGQRLHQVLIGVAFGHEGEVNTRPLGRKSPAGRPLWPLTAAPGAQTNTVMFVDEVNIRLKAGDGGNGCMSFRRVAHNPKGGPDGGNGGRGGDIILVCDPNTADFTDYKFKPHAAAKNGVPGKGSDKDGAHGSSLKLKMPPGTVVIDEATGRTVLELVEYGQEVVLLKGGKGGMGNTTFKSSTNQAPRKYTPGQPGEEGNYKLVLKSIADIGLVGFPNAGKSTLISLLTGAEPKTASYPFTTLQPTVAVVEYPQTYERLTMADIPGLIQGAHENRGLGHRFLRHIERCHLLLILIDMAGTDGRKPKDDYKQLIEELRLYDEAMLEKPRLIVANKMDEPEAKKNLTAFKRSVRHEILKLSCLSEEGLPELKETLRQRVLVDK